MRAFDTWGLTGHAYAPVKKIAALLVGATIAAGGVASAQPTWGELSARDCLSRSVGAHRDYQSILWHISGDNAVSRCKTVPATVNGTGGHLPYLCEWQGAYLWGKFEIEDNSCPIIYENKSDTIAFNAANKDFADRNADRAISESRVQTITFTFDPAGTSDEDIFQITNADQIELDLERDTYVFIHGFGSSPPQAFGTYPDGGLHSIVRTKFDDANVLTLDWSSLTPNNHASSYNYVYNRMWFVGWRLAEFLHNQGVDAKTTELIGYSLGAHVAAAAGNKYKELRAADATASNPLTDAEKQLSRIIGLDAAGILIGHLGKDVRLTPSAAVHVVGIHSSDARYPDTSNEAVGWYDPYGHLDIYILTKDFSSTFELLGSGNGAWRNNHHYANILYGALVWGGEDLILKSAAKWSWLYKTDFTQTFSYSDLATKKGKHTIAYSILP